MANYIAVEANPNYGKKVDGKVDDYPFGKILTYGSVTVDGARGEIDSRSEVGKKYVILNFVECREVERRSKPVNMKLNIETEDPEPEIDISKHEPVAVVTPPEPFAPDLEENGSQV